MVNLPFWCWQSAYPGCPAKQEYEVVGTRPRCRPKRTWREVVQKDCEAHKLNREDDMDHSRWRKLIKDG